MWRFLMTYMGGLVFTDHPYTEAEKRLADKAFNYSNSFLYKKGGFKYLYAKLMWKMVSKYI